jgi:hypothetical protein
MKVRRGPPTGKVYILYPMVPSWFTLAVVLVVVPAPSMAQESRWEEQVRAQLRRLGERHARDGYELSHDIYTGSLDDDETESVTLTLRRGVSYIIRAVCDEDCSDVDLRLYDEAGNEIDGDVEVDDFPLVTVTPRTTRTYRVRVIMATCTTAPCWFGVGVFSK